MSNGGICLLLQFLAGLHSSLQLFCQSSELPPQPANNKPQQAHSHGGCCLWHQSNHMGGICISIYAAGQSARTRYRSIQHDHYQAAEGHHIVNITQDQARGSIFMNSQHSDSGRPETRANHAKMHFCCFFAASAIASPFIEYGSVPVCIMAQAVGCHATFSSLAGSIHPRNPCGVLHPARCCSAVLI